MKESPNKRGKKQNRLLWLLLVLLAVCLAVLLFLYGQQNNYALLQDASSNAEGTTSSEETASQKEETNSRENSSRRSSGTSSRRTSSTAGSRVEETASSSPVESLPEEMGGGTTPILPAPETSGSTSSSPSGSSGTPSDSSSTPEEETPVRGQSAYGLTLQWETDSQSPFAQLWMDYASQQSLFGVLEGQGTPVTVHLHASAGTDFVISGDCFAVGRGFASEGAVGKLGIGFPKPKSQRIHLWLSEPSVCGALFPFHGSSANSGRGSAGVVGIGIAGIYASVWRIDGKVPGFSQPVPIDCSQIRRAAVEGNHILCFGEQLLLASSCFLV